MNRCQETLAKWKLEGFNKSGSTLSRRNTSKFRTVTSTWRASSAQAVWEKLKRHFVRALISKNWWVGWSLLTSYCFEQSECFALWPCGAKRSPEYVGRLWKCCFGMQRDLVNILRLCLVCAGEAVTGITASYFYNELVAMLCFVRNKAMLLWI